MYLKKKTNLKLDKYLTWMKTYLLAATICIYWLSWMYCISTYYTAIQKVIVWYFVTFCLLSELCRDAVRPQTTGNNSNIVWPSAFWLLDSTIHGDTQPERGCCRHFLLAVTHRWQWWASAALVLPHWICYSAEEVLCSALRESITWALQPSRVHLLQMYRRAVSDIPPSLRPVVAPVLWEPCSWCPQVTLDFWLSEQTAAGQQGVKSSAHLLIRLEESLGAHQHTGLCHVLSVSSFLSLILSECWVTALGVNVCNSNPLKMFSPLTNSFVWQPNHLLLSAFFPLVLWYFIYSVMFCFFIEISGEKISKWWRVK